MKKLLLLLVIVSGIAMAQNGRVYLKKNYNLAYDEATTTYAKNQIDTVLWDRDPAVSAISFTIHCKDSVRFANDSGCVIIRISDNAMTKVAGDTLNLSSKISTVDGNASALNFTNGAVYYFTPTFTPYTDQIGFIVKYGIAGCGVSTPNVVYRVNKIYAR